MANNFIFSFLRQQSGAELTLKLSKALFVLNFKPFDKSFHIIAAGVSIEVILTVVIVEIRCNAIAIILIILQYYCDSDILVALLQCVLIKSYLTAILNKDKTLHGYELENKHVGEVYFGFMNAKIVP